ncbi:MAG: hypothetical protein ABSG63_00745 [Spirochaetia bacterium]
MQGLHMYNMSTNPPLDIKDEMFDEQGQFRNVEAAFSRYKQPMQAVAAATGRKQGTLLRL